MVSGNDEKAMAATPVEAIVSAPSVVSFGAGTNSTAILQGMLELGEKPDAILFADTGGEKPKTHEHLERMQRWCKDVGFPELIVVRYSDTSRHASLEDECHNNGTLPSKAFGFGGCSQKWKRYPMDKWVKAWPAAQAAWEQGQRVQRVIGIHYGETKRGKIPDDAQFTYRFPLREWKWRQEECEAACVRACGYVPEKSACFYCPAMRKPEVLALAKEHPDLFQRAVEMEQNAREAGGLDVVKGLGRHWSWENLVKADNAQMRLFVEDGLPMCETCVDW